MKNREKIFSVAPMMDWTDRHCRAFHRVLTHHALLYTEMVTTGAVLHGNQERLLGFANEEHPVALQIGGSEPNDCAEAARIGEVWGYREINLNVGCPSDRVQSGRFGACLMAEPKLVGECIAAMGAAVDIPVTVKCRIGIDDQDDEEDFDKFVETVSAAGCRSFIVHARKAWLKGLSPKENRDIPPLNYERVYRLKTRRPDLEISLNGGISNLDAAAAHLNHVDGVMIGRAAYQTPWLLASVDQQMFGTNPQVRTRREALERYLPYVEAQVAGGVRLHHIARHMLGLFQGEPGARQWRRHLSENMHRDGAGPAILEDAVRAMELVAA
ncbi:MAG: tRNA dihydrouridine(20/20a) synthase DusA [Rhizobiales bacterium]|nr:tRNA dihydrouridine(20/20a) synthase DusA [Hyphomicrobiales bacterium]